MNWEIKLTEKLNINLGSVTHNYRIFIFNKEVIYTVMEYKVHFFDTQMK